MGGGKTCACPEGCACSCGCSWPHGHRWFRVIIGLIILALAFWVGVKIGELKTLVMRDGWGYGNYYGHTMMGYPGGYGGYGYGYDGSGYGGNAVPAPAQGAGTSSPATPATH